MSTPNAQSHIQVDKSHYAPANYLLAPRWNSYWHQIKSASELGAESALYVGIGDDIVPKLLESVGLEVKRFDFDADLGADYVGDVANIAGIVPTNSVDVVLCCQVLEHIPFEHFESAVESLLAIARKRVIISLPYRHTKLIGFRLKLPKIPMIRLDIEVSHFWRKWKFDGEHHWELGTRGYPVAAINKVLSATGLRTSTFRASENRYHVFFVIDK